MNDEELIKLAIEAKKNAKSPTGYHVGATLLTKSHKTYTGCNLASEDGLYNICAERVAIIKMMSEELEKIIKIVVVGGQEDELIYTVPCGICRQLIYNLGNDIEIVCAYYDDGELKQKRYCIEELLPAGYKM